MTTLAALQRKAASLEQETRRRYPDQAPVTLDHLTEEEYAGLEAWFHRMKDQGKVWYEGAARSPRLYYDQLTDDELDEAEYWFKVIHGREYWQQERTRQ